MKHVDISGDADDRFDLGRFISAQEKIYGGALAELRIGKKRTHWIWFVFPQIDGLGGSTMAQRYAIKSIGEARQRRLGGCGRR